MILVGVDISVDGLTLCVHGQPPQKLSYGDDWWRQIADLIVPSATVIAFEPTGWHYAQPLLTVAAHHNALLLQVEHRISKRVRETRIGGEKNDATDAQALALIAHEAVGLGVYYEGVHV